MAREYDPFMTGIISENTDLFRNAVFEWIGDGWGLKDDPEPEQIAAALLMEANTQDGCVKEGTSDKTYPDRLRTLAYQIIDHYHKPQPLPFKIVREGSNHDAIVVQRVKMTREAALFLMVQLARKEQDGLPNSPTLDTSGVDEVSIHIAQYRISSYRLERDE